MIKAASLTVRVKSNTKKRLDALAKVTRRSKSFVIEEALEQYLDVNEWQVKGIREALAEADAPGVTWIAHETVLKNREAKIAHNLAKAGTPRPR